MAIKINNVLINKNDRRDISIEYFENIEINGDNLLMLDGLVDPHVHFRTPGLTHKEDWKHGALSALKGGITTVFDMPNTVPATTTEKLLKEKKQLIDAELESCKLPLRYSLFFGANKQNYHEISKVKDKIIGIKIFMSSAGELLLDDDSSLHAIYALAAFHGLLLAFHAEDEKTILCETVKYQNNTEYSVHSLIRSTSAAVIAVKKIIQLADEYKVKSYILHISTEDELELIKDAKSKFIPVFAETCPHYLFLSDDDYKTLGGYAKVNPPLRIKNHQTAVWNAINTGVIDTIASDHAPHTSEEKQLARINCPSGMPGIETTLPLMITAWKENKTTLEKIIEIMSINPKKIFNLPINNDFILVDIFNYKTINNQSLATKCKWSAYHGMNLTGFPHYVFCNNKLIYLSTVSNF